MENISMDEFLFRHSSNSWKLSRQKFHNELVYSLLNYASKKMANRNSANHKFLIAPHIISITFNSSLAMVYFLGRLEVRKGYFSIQVCGKRGNIDNNYYRAISVISMIGKVFERIIYRSSPLCQFYRIIVFCLRTKIRIPLCSIQ